MSEQGFIYAIQSRETKLIKIGFSARPEGRLKGLQTGSAQKLELLKTWPGTMDDEKRIHRFLRRYRKHGEWFEVDFDRAAFVIHGCTRPRDINDDIQSLHSALVRAAEAGLSAKVLEEISEDGQTPIVTIRFYNVAICHSHKMMHFGTACPMC